MKKRGQITLFIIMGIMLVLGSLIFFLVKDIVFDVEEIDNQEVIDKLRYDTYSCLKDLGKEAIVSISEKGGYVYLPEHSSEGNIKTSYYLYENIKRIPSKQDIEQEVAKYIDYNHMRCIPIDEGYEITYSEPEVSALIKDKDIFVSTNLSIYTTIDKITYEIDSLNFVIDQKPIIEILDLSEKILEKDDFSIIKIFNNAEKSQTNISLLRQGHTVFFFITKGDIEWRFAAKYPLKEIDDIEEETIEIGRITINPLRLKIFKDTGVYIEKGFSQDTLKNIENIFSRLDIEGLFLDKMILRKSLELEITISEDPLKKIIIKIPDDISYQELESFILDELVYYIGFDEIRFDSDYDLAVSRIDNQTLFIKRSLSPVLEKMAQNTEKLSLLSKEEEKAMFREPLEPENIYRYLSENTVSEEKQTLLEKMARNMERVVYQFIQIRKLVDEKIILEDIDKEWDDFESRAKAIRIYIKQDNLDSRLIIKERISDDSEGVKSQEYQRISSIS